MRALKHSNAWSYLPVTIAFNAFNVRGITAKLMVVVCSILPKLLSIRPYSALLGSWALSHFRLREQGTNGLGKNATDRFVCYVTTVHLLGKRHLAMQHYQPDRTCKNV
jgi:hypothetical protein